MEKQILFDIKIFEGGEVKLNSKANNTVISKTVSLQHFLSTFGQSFSTFETPILPTNCRKIVKSSNSELYIFEYAPSVRTINYLHTEYENVACPRALFVIKVTTNGVRIMSKSDIYILDPLTPFSENMTLYKWCFNNYSYYPASTGSRSYICWGSAMNSFDAILQGPTSNYGAFFNLYMSSVFNSHLPQNIPMTGVNRTHNCDMLDLIIHLQNNKLFPMSATTPTRDTVASIVARFKEGTY